MPRGRRLAHGTRRRLRALQALAREEGRQWVAFPKKTSRASATPPTWSRSSPRRVLLKQKGRLFWGNCPVPRREDAVVQDRSRHAAVALLRLRPGRRRVRLRDAAENLEFPDAVRRLAERARIEIVEEGGGMPAGPQGAAHRRVRGGGRVLPQAAHQLGSEPGAAAGARVPREARLRHRRGQALARSATRPAVATRSSDALVERRVHARRARRREPRARRDDAARSRTASSTASCSPSPTCTGARSRSAAA